jgi:hypothetical protein
MPPGGERRGRHPSLPRLGPTDRQRDERRRSCRCNRQLAGGRRQPAPSISSTIQYQLPTVFSATGEPGSQCARNCWNAPRSWASRCSRTSRPPGRAPSPSGFCCSSSSWSVLPFSVVALRGRQPLPDHLDVLLWRRDALLRFLLKSMKDILPAKCAVYTARYVLVSCRSTMSITQAPPKPFSGLAAGSGGSSRLPYRRINPGDVLVERKRRHRDHP